MKNALPHNQAEQSAPSKREFNAKSTSTEAQYDRIIRMLRAGEKSTFDFRRVGICAPAARIKELNDKHGYYIPTVALRDIWDDEGYCHPRVAVYELIDEPKEERAGFVKLVKLAHVQHVQHVQDLVNGERA